MEDLTLFEMTNSYDILHLKEICRDEIKAKFPKALDEEDFLDYLDFLESETDLLYAERLREIAQQIEDRIYGAQREEIRRIYKNEFKHT